MPIQFPLTNTAVKAQWELVGFPCIFSQEKWDALIEEALEQMQQATPVYALASFQTVEMQADYLVFDPSDTTTAGICADALAITNVYWNPGGDWSSINIFNPGWQMLSHVLLFTGSYFHQPSQMMILRQKLDAWKEQFGSQGFEVYGMVGAPASYLKIFPVPQETGSPVLVEFIKKYTVADVTEAAYRFFKQWMDYYVAFAAASFYASTAGIELLGFVDSSKTAAYWERKSKEFYDRAMDSQAGIQGQMART